MENRKCLVPSSGQMSIQPRRRVTSIYISYNTCARSRKNVSPQPSQNFLMLMAHTLVTSIVAYHQRIFTQFKFSCVGVCVRYEVSVCFCLSLLDSTSINFGIYTWYQSFCINRQTVSLNSGVVGIKRKSALSTCK